MHPDNEELIKTLGVLFFLLIIVGFITALIHIPILRKISIAAIIAIVIVLAALILRQEYRNYKDEKNSPLYYYNYNEKEKAWERFTDEFRISIYPFEERRAFGTYEWKDKREELPSYTKYRYGVDRIERKEDGGFNIFKIRRSPYYNTLEECNKMLEGFIEEEVERYKSIT